MKEKSFLDEARCDLVVSKKVLAINYVKTKCKRYFIDAFTGMAQGLFCTLIAGTILGQIASWCGTNAFATVLNYIASIAKTMMGVGIGIGMAHKLGAKPLVIFTAAVVGFIGAWSGSLVDALTKGTAFTLSLGAPGNPIGSYVAVLFALEIVKLYAGKTKIDIVLVPLSMMILCFGGIFLAWPFIKLIDLLAQLIVLAISAGVAFKIIVGIFVSVVMGILLTMPTSSAAIWVAIATSATAVANPEPFGIAGGAAVAGCAAHMVGFAVASFRENGWGGLISQGIGTSMLQIPNIMKKPVIMLPEIIASVFAGLVAVLIDLRCNATGGGMGTSGLVGVFGTIDASMAVGLETYKLVLGIALCLFVIPAVVSFAVSEILRKTNVIKFGDQSLDD
ncbi:singapore isolate B (sub-type 7) whole genome shotgun sequence assembly scaffold_12 [Acidaminococcus sp. CAG:917]|nr:singapore isolate B (sub-type 7) whole genome shotgun sequence assembly scaffold_12 [Acidaminococcus sp. CAG:917]